MKDQFKQVNIFKLQLGAPTYAFAKISEKLHKFEDILGRGGGGVRQVGTPRSASALSPLDTLQPGRNMRPVTRKGPGIRDTLALSVKSHLAVKTLPSRNYCVATSCDNLVN